MTFGTVISEDVDFITGCPSGILGDGFCYDGLLWTDFIGLSLVGGGWTEV